MARYTDSVCKLCRREGLKLFLKGDRCFKDKCAFERKGYPPGQHGQRRTKISDYGLQLREKQKVKRIYGILEGQFRQYFEKATRMSGITGEKLLQMLERRLDNVIYRSGFARSRAEARHVVGHRHFMVNGKIVNIPSYLVRPDDKIEVKEKSVEIDKINESIRTAEGRGIPDWLTVDKEKFVSHINRLPERSDITTEIEEHMIVELYSK